VRLNDPPAPLNDAAARRREEDKVATQVPDRTLTTGFQGKQTLRIVIAAIVVVVGLAAMIGALALILHHYPAGSDKPGAGATATSTSGGGDNSTSVVAILTPLATAIVGVIGLYFGVSATGSPRGQAAETAAQTAATQDAALKLAAVTPVDEAKKALGLV
jgi:hypothetical protein